MTGVLYDEQLTPVLESAAIGLVSQRADVAEFNLPSKLMNYMAYGLPVIASVRPDSETAKIVEESGAGWVTDAADPAEFASRAIAALRHPVDIESAGEAGFSFASSNFDPASVAQRILAVLPGA
jgi:colanic acid biosynthesis glycosyl transferase WcaI